MHRPPAHIRHVPSNYIRKTPQFFSGRWRTARFRAYRTSRQVLQPEHRGDPDALRLVRPRIDRSADGVPQALLKPVLARVAARPEDLDGRQRGRHVGLAGDQLGHRDLGGDAAAFGEATCGVVQVLARVFQADLHVDDLAGDVLVGADGCAEGLAGLRILDAALHPLLHLADHHHEDAQDLVVHDVLEDEEAGTGLAEHVRPGHATVAELELAERARVEPQLLDRLTDVEPWRVGWHQERGDAGGPTLRTGLGVDRDDIGEGAAA